MGRRKVLVIDEDKSSIDLFGKALEPKGIDVFVQETTDKGIEKAIEVEPDLIFINLIFRASNGLKVSKLIHEIEKLRNVPIVMLLAHKSDLDPKYTSTIGIVDVLVRPLTEQNIALKTLAVLGEQAPVAAPESVPESVAEEETFVDIISEEELQSLAGDALPIETAAPHAEDETKYDLDFTEEGDILIDQAIIDPGKGKKKMFERDDDKAKEDVIDLRRPKVPALGDTPGDKSDEEIDMEERNLFDENKDRKKAAIDKSVEEELDELATETSSEHDLSDDRDYDEDEAFEEEKPGTGKKVLFVIAGVVLIAGLALGAYLVKIAYFDNETAKVAPLSQKEVVKETLPPSAEVKEPQSPADKTASSGVPASAPDEKVPPAAVTAKKEPAAPAVPQATKSVPPAPPETPAAKSEQKSIEQKLSESKSPESKSVEQKPVEKSAVKPAPQTAAKQAEKPKAEVAATSLKKDVGQAKAFGEKTSGKFAVQAGYFESGKNAEALVSTLKEKGYESYIIKNEVSGKGKNAARTFYRVLIGRFDTDKKAAAYVRELKRKDNISVVVHRN